MVGRLVEQQDVGRRRQRAGQGGAARLAAGQGGGVFCAGQAELLQQIACAMVVGIGVGAQPRLDIGERGGKPGKVGLLRQVADGGARLGEAAAGVGLHQAGGDAQQGGLAGAVAPDQADAVAGGNRQAGAGQQRRGAECQVDVLEQQGRGHGRGHSMWAGAVRRGGGAAAMTLARRRGRQAIGRDRLVRLRYRRVSLRYRHAAPPWSDAEALGPAASLGLLAGALLAGRRANLRHHPNARAEVLCHGIANAPRRWANHCRFEVTTWEQTIPARTSQFDTDEVSMFGASADRGKAIERTAGEQSSNPASNSLKHRVSQSIQRVPQRDRPAPSKPGQRTAPACHCGVAHPLREAPWCWLLGDRCVLCDLWVSASLYGMTTGLAARACSP